jgi:uncharacterized Fe-S cluster-containing protein
MLFREWVAITGREFKEIVSMNKGFVHLNGYVFKFNNEVPLEDNEVYLVESEGNELVISKIHNGKEVVRKKGTLFY